LPLGRLGSVAAGESAGAGEAHGPADCRVGWRLAGKPRKTSRRLRLLGSSRVWVCYRPGLCADPSATSAAFLALNRWPATWD
jgi:hypothetical protein